MVNTTVLHHQFLYFFFVFLTKTDLKDNNTTTSSQMRECRTEGPKHYYFLIVGVAKYFQVSF